MISNEQDDNHQDKCRRLTSEDLYWLNKTRYTLVRLIRFDNTPDTLDCIKQLTDIIYRENRKYNNYHSSLDNSIDE